MYPNEHSRKLANEIRPTKPNQPCWGRTLHHSDATTRHSDCALVVLRGSSRIPRGLRGLQRSTITPGNLWQSPAISSLHKVTRSGNVNEVVGLIIQKLVRPVRSRAPWSGCQRHSQLPWQRKTNTLSWLFFSHFIPGFRRVPFVAICSRSEYDRPDRCYKHFSFSLLAFTSAFFFRRGLHF